MMQKTYATASISIIKLTIVWIAMYVSIIALISMRYLLRIKTLTICYFLTIVGVIVSIYGTVQSVKVVPTVSYVPDW